jgi:hypothetical protein
VLKFLTPSFHTIITAIPCRNATFMPDYYKQCAKQSSVYAWLIMIHPGETLHVVIVFSLLSYKHTRKQLRPRHRQYVGRLIAGMAICIRQGVCSIRVSLAGTDTKSVNVLSFLIEDIAQRCAVCEDSPRYRFVDIHVLHDQLDCHFRN